MARSQTAQFATFLLVALSILASGHWYVALRLVLDTGMSAPYRQLSLTFLAAMGGLILLQPVVRHRLPHWAMRAMAWPVWIWCGVWFLTVALLGISDLLLWLLGVANAGPEGLELSRLQAKGVVAGVLLLSVVSLVNGLRVAAIRRVEIRLPGWPAALDGFSIVQISDIHIGAILGRRFAQQVVDRCNGQSPDLTVITGDLVDGSAENLADDVAPFSDLTARHGVYFVTGNHDHYAGVDRWCEILDQMGLIPLRNTRVTVADGAFCLAGVDDHNPLLADGDREAHQAALGGRDVNLPTILLAHDPVTFPMAAGHRVGLQLSGHTHGGQIWPFRYVVRLSTKYVAGHYRQGESQLYVSRGTGFWGPPMRLFAPAEITLLTIFGK
jgi:predicted MPP superfamily phosphohydrolase